MEDYEIFLYYLKDEIDSNGKNYIYKIKCIFREEVFEYDFNDSRHNFINGIKLDEKGLQETFYYYISDAIAGGNYDFPGFVEEFGYQDAGEAYKIHQACEKSFSELESVTDLDELEYIISLLNC